jgi:hypothetical protein
MACLRLIALPISGIGSNLLLPIARLVCLSLPLLISFSIRNSPQIGELRVEKPHFLNG